MIEFEILQFTAMLTGGMIIVFSKEYFFPSLSFFFRSIAFVSSRLSLFAAEIGNHTGNWNRTTPSLPAVASGSSAAWKRRASSYTRRSPRSRG